MKSVGWFACIGTLLACLTGCETSDDHNAVISTVPRTNNPHLIEDPYRSSYPMGRI